MAAPKGNNFAEGNNGGRPSKFTEETNQKALEYLANAKDYEDENGKFVVNIPSIMGLARWLNVSTDTLTNWRSENEEFFGIYASVLAEQGKRLIDNGLSGKYNPTIAKLMLTKHGYSDKQELTGKDGEKLEMGVVILPSKNESTLEATA